MKCTMALVSAGRLQYEQNIDFVQELGCTSLIALEKLCLFGELEWHVLELFGGLHN